MLSFADHEKSRRGGVRPRPALQIHYISEGHPAIREEGKIAESEDADCGIPECELRNLRVRRLQDFMDSS